MRAPQSCFGVRYRVVGRWSTAVGHRSCVSIQFLFTGRVAENDGYIGRWRGIFDDKGRVMILICHNMDLGDAWEWADHPQYPERYASLAYRVGINNIIYAMTH